MSMDDGTLPGGANFERSLIDAGRRDDFAPDPSDKWAQFASRLSLVSSTLDRVSGVHDLAPRADGAGSNGGLEGGGEQLVARGAELSGTSAGMGAAGAGLSAAAGAAQATSAWGAKLAVLKAGVVGVVAAGGIAAGALGQQVWVELRGTDGGREAPEATEVVESPAGVGSEERSPRREDDSPQWAAAPLSFSFAPMTMQGATYGAVAQPEPAANRLQDSRSRGLAVDDSDEMDAPNKATYPREQTRIPSSLEVGSTKLRDASTRREASTLRNETERLDEARRAGGARALYLVRRFHDEFPDSSLAADAEIVALRALLRLGEQQLFRERALSFLARFPGDPHEGHVTRWLEE